MANLIYYALITSYSEQSEKKKIASVSHSA